MSDSTQEMNDKRELLEQLLKEGGIDLLGTSISPRQKFSPCPLSFAQKRLWFLHELQPDSSVYHVPVTFILKGKVNEEALNESLNRIIERHEVLRTNIGVVAGQPCQLISREARLQLELEDLTGLPEEERFGAALARARAEAERPFALSAGLLMRARLLRLGEQEQVLLLCLHHIVCDGWSMEVLFGELEQFYNSACTGAAARVRELPVQYADYALWQRERLQGAVLAEELGYWREQLRGELGVLELPADQVRPARQSYRGGVVRHGLGAELRERVQGLGREQGVTLFMVLLAALQTLLWRYTGAAEIVVGTPVANRQQVEVEGLIGFFVNTLALRTRLRGELRFTELLVQVKEMCLGAYGHQELPFEKLVAELQPERSLAHSPLFQVMFATRNDKRRCLRLHGLDVSRLSFEQATAKFDWLFYTFFTQNGLQVALEYNSDLFEPATAQRVLGHYERLLRGIVINPERRLDELPLLTDQERHQLLVEWSNTKTKFSSPLCLHELVEAQVEKTPDSPAVKFAEQKLSYRGLNDRANRLAHYLIEQGVKPEDRVGVLLERSLEMVVSLLAVLKTGARYVPLEPQYPTQRLLTMIADAELKLILTQERFREQLGSIAITEILLESETDILAEYPDKDPQIEVHPGNAAYMIYTSGSTGKPKGVINTHSGVCNRLLWMRQAYPLTSDDRVLQKTPFSFDVSIWEFFWPLITGACLVVARPGGHQDSEYLIRLIEEERLTTLHFVPSMLRVFLDEKGVERCSSLKRVFCSGEALPYEVQEKFFKHLGAELYNLYGPTEAAIEATFCKCEANESGVVPIGRPIANTEVYVLDERQGPVPIGVVGELYLGGAGLARGYWQQPGMTAEKFVPHRFSATGGQRLYRTGDMVRYLASGELEFLGRRDSQVKLRGHRIELGEIEAVLRRHEQVRDAVVEMRVGEVGEGRLVGYLVLTGDDEQVTMSEVRKYLREHLPEYMVPGAFVLLDELPLTSSGKIDRRALPAPDTSATGKVMDHAPQTAMEQNLMELWQEILGLERVGLQDNFFDLGGHSLLLVQIRHQLRERFGWDLSLLELFECPTISLLAARLREQQGMETAQDSAQWLTQARRRALVRRGDSGARSNEVAIIGMAGRFPGARNLEELWQNLRQGREAIREFSEDEVRAAGISRELLSKARYVRAGSVLEDVEWFDAAFFGITPREAEIMDPQQRLFLECAWETFEDAGYDPQSYQLPIGVFAGLSMNTYLPRLYANPALLSTLNRAYAQLGNDKDFLSTRVSYKLGLTGPSLTVQTACSTSLVAVHLACQSLINGECSMALAGGVSIRFPQKAGYLYQEGGIRSSDGHCRPFDANAAGTVGGSGVGIVLLKRLSAALADGDSIRAVIKGSAINNDGAVRVGYTAPGIEGQAAVIAEAQAIAGVSAKTISYIEAHGTATALGDPIEIAALTKAFRAHTLDRQYCAIGSVKSNIGHLDTAAGVAGLIKTVLALEHEELPPSLYYESPNPEIDFAASPFYVNAQLRQWKRKPGQPRRSGVSSFGIGGTNAHVILEEAPKVSREKRAPDDALQILVLSGRTSSALAAARERLAEHLDQHPERSLADIAYTLQVG